jgi:predicted nucleotidyltransferase
MAARIAREPGVEQIILFGSQATGKARPESDIDLFVVQQTTKSFTRRCAAVKKTLDDLRDKIPVWPIVMTPQEVRQRLAIEDQFIEEILTQGIRFL